MTVPEIIERILWIMDGYRFEYLTRAEAINRLTELIEHGDRPSQAAP